jgi:hypothetical protein
MMTVRVVDGESCVWYTYLDRFEALKYAVMVVVGSPIPTPHAGLTRGIAFTNLGGARA